jgi:hypothetical protein
MHGFDDDKADDCAGYLREESEGNRGIEIFSFWICF